MSTFRINGLSNIKIGASRPVQTKTWTRPSDWLTLPSMTSSDQKVVILHAVWPNSDNFCAFTVAGAYTVDWGDGTVENFTTGATAYHKFDYNNVALDGTLSTRGYKQSIVTITPQAGQNLTSVNLRVNHNQTGLVVGGYATGFLDMKISLPNASASGLSIGTTVNTVPYHLYLEKVEILNWGGINSTLNLFYNCWALRQVIWPSTGSMTNMSQTFPYCYALQSISPGVNTYSSTNTAAMFYNCYSLQTLPNALDLRASINAVQMFFQCYNLTEVSLLNTGNVASFANTFQACESMQVAPSINTAAAANMAAMFLNCQLIKTVPQYTTNSCTNMSQMFNGCSALESVPLMNTSAVTNTSAMFFGCVSLKSIPSIDTRASTNCAGMFFNCYSLTSVPTLNTAVCTNFSNTFQGCVSLQTGPVLVTNVATNMQNMFSTCYNLVSTPDYVTGNVTSMSNMFAGCINMPTAPNLNTAAVANMQQMFLNCTTLTTIPSYDTRSVTNMIQLFQGCGNLQTVPSMNTALVTSVNNMFFQCSSLQSVGSMNWGNVTSTGLANTFIGNKSMTSMSANNIKFTFTVASSQLSNTALNTIFTNLASVVGQTITTTGNYGSATANATIATNKGWTVVG